MSKANNKIYVLKKELKDLRVEQSVYGNGILVATSGEELAKHFKQYEILTERYLEIAYDLINDLEKK